MRNPNTLLVGDTLYEISKPYRAGARAMRNETVFFANPHRQGSRAHDEWAYGHDHEACGFHILDGKDVIEATNAGLEFAVPDEMVDAH